MRLLVTMLDGTYDGPRTQCKYPWEEDYHTTLLRDCCSNSDPLKVRENEVFTKQDMQ